METTVKDGAVFSGKGALVGDKDKVELPFHTLVSRPTVDRYSLPVSGM